MLMLARDQTRKTTAKTKLNNRAVRIGYRWMSMMKYLDWQTSQFSLARCYKHIIE